MNTNNTNKSKKTILILLIGILVIVGIYFGINQPVGKVKNIVVYKDPSCGCCNAWIKHLKKNDFNVEVHDEKNMQSIKSRLMVPGNLQSCHTATIDGYTIEGHVPADVIERLVNEKPEVLGLTVPGMPMGTPGMEGPRKDPYDVLTFNERKETSVYASR